MKKQDYVTPKLTVIGTAADITMAYNKIGGNADTYTEATGGAIIGSLIPYKP